MRTLLAIGGAGYVGSHACKAFAEAGWRVVVFDNLSTGWRDLARWGELLVGDMLDPAALRTVLGQRRPDVIAHFAGLSDVAQSMAEPDLYSRVNVGGARNLLEAMRETGNGRLVFSSSAAVYGQQDEPLAETSPIAPQSPYGASKAEIERLIDEANRVFGLRTISLRYFNAAGADAAGEAGERHRPETHLIPRAIAHARPGRDPLVVHGADFATRDGTAVRDYVHVSDLADAHVSAAIDLMAGGETAAINLGTGHGASVLEVLAAVEAAAGRPLPRLIGPRRPGDPASLVASNTLARKRLNWTPRRSNIHEIVQTAWRWHAQEADAGRD